MSLSSLEPTWLHQILFVHLVIAITYLTFTMHQGHYETLHRPWPCALQQNKMDIHSPVSEEEMATLKNEDISSRQKQVAYGTFRIWIQILVLLKK